MLKWFVIVLVWAVTVVAYAGSYNTDTYTVECDARTSTGTIAFKDLIDIEVLTISWNESNPKCTHLDVSIHPGMMLLENDTEYTATLYPSTGVPILIFDSLKKSNDNTLTATYANSYIQLNRIAQWCKYQKTDTAVFLYINDTRVSTIPIKDVWYIGDLILDYISTFKGAYYAE